MKKKKNLKGEIVRRIDLWVFEGWILGERKWLWVKDGEITFFLALFFRRLRTDSVGLFVETIVQN